MATEQSDEALVDIPFDDLKPLGLFNYREVRAPQKKRV
jgi:hypothetical protein